jgi:hypothetical protein
MNRRSIVIIVGALAIAALIVVSWLWLFSRGASVPGGFGSAGNKTATTTAGTLPTTNIGTNITTETNAGSGQATNIPIGGTGAGGEGTVGGTAGTGSVISSSTSVSGNVGTVTVPGVQWLGGTSAGGTSGAATSNFEPSSVNQLNDGTTGGQVSIFGSAPAPSSVSDESSILASLGVAAVGTALCTAGLITPLASGGATSASVSAASLATANGIGVAAVPTSDKGLYTLLTGQIGFTNANLQAQNQKLTFYDCIARTLGRAVVSQITASVVNWINGGFNGSPSFVQNYQQFFGNVADLAAGAYIQGSALSFLCSPFQLQIKIAVAQSYANRNAQSCSLTSVTNNVNNFLNGTFSSGGWPALLQFTTVPTNNPYGAYAYAQIGLISAQNNAATNANRSVTPGGFIDFVQLSGCSNTSNNGLQQPSLFASPAQAAAATYPAGCKATVTTPGTVIQNALDNTQNSSQNILAEAGVSGSFDTIINALLSQLVVKTLQGGLSNLSGTAGYASNFLTPDQQQAETQGNSLLTSLQAAQQVATQYGQTEQGAVTDIQSAQQQLSTLDGCWQSAGNTAEASSTEESIAALQTQVDQYNNNITGANASIAALNTLMSDTLAVTSTADVSNVTSQFNTAASSGQLITQDQATNALDDRATLDSSLAAQNTQTAAGLAQCQGSTQ